MDPLTAIGLVGNTIQLLDFGSKIVSKSTQLYQSNQDALAEVIDTETAAIHLRFLNDQMKDTAAQDGDKILLNICKSCGAVADELLAALEKVKIKGKDKNSKWQSVRVALRTIWSKEELSQLERRLQMFREQLNLHVTLDLREQMKQISLDQSDGLRNIDSTTKDIMEAISQQRDVFQAAQQSQNALMNDLHKEILVKKPNHEESTSDVQGLQTAPSSTVPFRRDPDFIHRSSLLDQIDNICAKEASRVALVGLGGVGKSQLAIEYSYRVRERSPKTWVFWVYASTTVRFEEGYREIAEIVKIPDRNKPKADILRLVSQWLCDEANGRWVLILDNADDASLFSSPLAGKRDSKVEEPGLLPAVVLSKYLPQSSNGSILVTTRNNEVAFKLAGNHDNIIKVEPMDLNDSLALLRVKIGAHFDEEAAPELVKTLDFMPLAITQAAAYIRQRAPRSSVASYLHDFRKSEKKKTNLLNYDAGDLRRDPTASNSINMTWQISFDYIRSVRPSAAELLSLMSFFDRQGIPEYLLQRTSDSKSTAPTPNSLYEDTDSDSDSDTDEDFEDDLAMLRSYSLINVNAEGDSFEMHRLVQLSTRKWLEAQGQLEKWKQEYIKKLTEAYPGAEYINWNTCQRLFAHAETLLEHRPVDNKSMEDWAQVLHNAGWYAMSQGKYPIASKMTEKAFKARESVLGNDHKLSLATAGNMALLLRYQGRYGDAEALSWQILDGRERVLGTDHVDTLASANNLAAMLRYQGKYMQAEGLIKRALEGREKLLGIDHPDTLVSINDYALILRYQGKYAEAETYIRRALEGSEKSLGKDHPSTLRNLSKLATILQYQGKDEEAETIHRRAVQGYEKVLGALHPDTLTAFSKLSLVLRRRSKYVEAEEMNRRVLVGRERHLGKSHPSTLASVTHLGILLKEQGRYTEAEELIRRALTGREEALGKDHPDTLTSTDNLASILFEQGKYEAAEKMHRQSLEGRERILGCNHPDVLTSSYSLARTLHKQKQYEAALNLYETTSKRYEQNLGHDHPSTVACHQCYESLKEEISSTKGDAILC